MAEALEDASDALVVSPYVIAEIDYLAATRLGVLAELAILDELASGAYVLPGVDADELHQARRVIERFADQQIGLADASLVVVADRYCTRSILTLDRRHFEVLTPRSGGRFRLVPE